MPTALTRICWDSARVDQRKFTSTCAHDVGGGKIVSSTLNADREAPALTPTHLKSSHHRSPAVVEVNPP